MRRLARASRLTFAILAESLLARWRTGRAIRRPLSRFSDREIDIALGSAGKSRVHLFAVGPGNAPHRMRMTRLMTHFGVAPEFAVRYFIKRVFLIAFR